MIPVVPSAFEKALARAIKENIQIIGTVTDKATKRRSYAVQSSDGEKIYFVDCETFSCTCPARTFCKHQAICLARVRRRAQEVREQIALKQDAIRAAALMTRNDGGRRLWR